MPDAIEQVILRLPPDVKPALRKAAKENRRSLNGEAIFRLAQSLQSDGQLPRNKEAA